uniref:DUF2934 domain-containing protein n=1 Tax=Candidatus Kentrum sp. TUN TaxID=2126343 RepID=A0A450Z970_9GAMM|nr:MAG: Protein of unknown function (DUF2934) [Candidatus Kentron sp. TUN]VFK51422.1 MAG: Protein of unknown function (DUF2934) [Candidatus Kentron sp. TUN]VFK58007.1 MAG: Protein of unknown function (DUF2934) [Candidatus Kentron sp. TUN]
MIQKGKPVTEVSAGGTKENREVDSTIGATRTIATDDMTEATSSEHKPTDNELATEALNRQALANNPVTPEERWNMIAVAAYYRAEERGFIGGNPAEDWIAAEKEIDTLLNGKK